MVTRLLGILAFLAAETWVLTMLAGVSMSLGDSSRTEGFPIWAN